MFKQLGLIGCGLMGGSFALALKRAGLVQTVVGHSQSPASAQKALKLGVVDRVVGTAAEAAQGADLVLVAVPVAAIEATLQAIGPYLSPESLVMDVGSTKQDVVLGARRALGAQLDRFVPAHPIAGKEHAGVEHATADLYDGCQVVLTPTEDTSSISTERAHALWQALGCRVRRMTPEAHDEAYAAVSHLPHLLAFAMMKAIQDQSRGEAFLTLAGPGFRDFTRIAASEPSVWRDILISNRQAVLEQLDHYQQALNAFEAALIAEDAPALRELIASASAARADWRLGQGPSTD
ncbi:TyrA Prephenate dehydrogenase [Burkholderiaceae bacterium]